MSWQEHRTGGKMNLLKGGEWGEGGAGGACRAVKVREAVWAARRRERRVTVRNHTSAIT